MTQSVDIDSPDTDIPALPANGIATTLRAAWAIFRKDIACELRTRYAINTLLLFAVSATTAISLGVGFLGLRRTQEALLIQSALCGLPCCLPHSMVCHAVSSTKKRLEHSRHCD